MTPIGIAILALLTLGFLALGYYRRSWAVAVFVALLPVYLVRFQLAVPGLPAVPSTWLEILFVALFLPWLFERGFRAEAWFGLRRWIFPVTLLLTGSAVAVLVSADRIAGLGLWRAYFVEPILLFAVFTDTIRTVRERKLVLVAMAATLAVVGLTAVFQKFTGYGIPNPIWQAAETRRVTSFYGFPNAIGLYLAPITVLLAAWSSSLFLEQGGRRQSVALCLGRPGPARRRRLPVCRLQGSPNRHRCRLGHLWLAEKTSSRGPRWGSSWSA